jgi:hypothetical protein
VAVHIDLALDIHEAVMEGIHLRDEERQRLQVGPFVATRSTARRSSMVASDGIRIAFRSGYPV